MSDATAQFEQGAWYDGAFTSLVAEFWRAALPEAETQAECLYLEIMLRCPTNADSHFLDVMCGSARLARPLAEMGYRVTGLDLSPAMLADARRMPLPPTLSLVQGDIRDLDAQDRFDGAFCFGNSWGYLTHGDNLAFLHRLHSALKPDARFVIETGAVAESLLPDFRPDVRLTTGDFAFHARHRYDAAQSILYTDFHITRGQEQAHFQGRQTIYTLGELNRMMQTAGFSPIVFHEAPDFSPFKIGSDRLLAVYART